MRVLLLIISAICFLAAALCAFGPLKMSAAGFAFLGISAYVLSGANLPTPRG